MLLENSLTFTKQVNRQYSKQFAQEGAKIGATLNIRVPAQYAVSNGPNLSVQNFTETQVPLVINQQKHIDVSFSSVELTLSLQDFSDRVLAPQVAQLANQIDQDGLALAASVYNSVGAAGTANTTLAPYLAAGVLLDNSGTPRDIDKRNIVLSPQGQADIVGGTPLTYFNDQDTLAKQYRNGTMGRAVGFKWSMDQNVATITNGPMGGTPVVNGATQTGSTLLVNGWTAAAASRLLGGEVFTLPLVYAVNPLSKTTTGKLQQFVVVGAVASDGAGASSLTISPAIVTSGATQNVTASPASGAALTFVGAANVACPIGLAFHSQAFTFASVDLEDVSKYGTYGARVSDDQLGISMRLVRQYQAATDVTVARLDILYGWACIRPQMAVRVLGSNS